jgi:hypothetical protein
MAPSNTAAPSGRSSHHTPIALIIATIAAIDRNASRSGSHQRRSRSGTPSCSPTANSEISSATSASRSSTAACATGSGRSTFVPSGPSSQPSAR